jgi:thiamine kinase-like enzyme
MEILPQYIDDFLKTHSYELDSIIQINSWKNTYVLKIKKNNKYYLLKSIGLAAPEDIKDKFYTETQFYIENKHKEYLPKLVSLYDRFLILEFIDGVGLREAIKCKKLKEKHLKSLFEVLDTLYIDNKKIADGTSFNFNNAFNNLVALIQSCPMQNKNIKVPILGRVHQKINILFYKKRLKKILNNIDLNSLKIGFVHGDLHFNNIIITNEDKIILIDFENINYQGCFDFDILFLLAILEKSLSYYNSDLNINFYKISKELFDIKEIYVSAIKSNTRFY